MTKSCNYATAIEIVSHVILVFLPHEVSFIAKQKYINNSGGHNKFPAEFLHSAHNVSSEILYRYYLKDKPELHQFFDRCINYTCSSYVLQK